jgi:hypothetical protein
MTLLLWPASLQVVQSALAESKSWSVSSYSKREVDPLVVAAVTEFSVQSKKVSLSKPGVIQ